MVTREQIQMDLTNYAKKKDSDVITVVSQLLSFASEEQLKEWSHLSKAEQAWNVLQTLEGKPQDIFTTKRFLYSILHDRIINKIGCFGILGTRHSGKTTLLLQLHAQYKDNSVYLDCTNIDNTFDFSIFYNELVQKGIHLVLIDEVCKIKDSNYADFIKYTKIYFGRLCIIITGSVQTLVDTLCDRIGSRETFTLPPIMYIEKLSWEHGFDEINLDCIKECVNDNTLKTYLKNQFMPQRELSDYMSGIVKDTIDSYRWNCNLEGDLGINAKKLSDALKYISLCQMIYKRPSDNTYINVPIIEKDILNAINNQDYQKARYKYNLTSNDISTAISILAGSNLIRKTSIIDSLKQDELPLDSVIFEYPWYSSYCFGPAIQESGNMMNIWVEYALLLRLSYIYLGTAKYRSITQEEIDIVYLTDRWNGLEVKDRPLANVAHSYMKRLKILKNNLGLKTLICSCSDINAQLVAAFELEYVNICRNSLIESERSIIDICKDNLNFDINKECIL